MILKSEQLVLSLIRQAITPGCCTDPVLLKKADWEEVVNLAFEHGVLGICLDGVETVPDDCRPDSRIKMEWLGQVICMEEQYRQHEKAVKELASFYRQQGIRMMLLKGYGLSQYWPVSTHRPVGDIDVYLGQHWHRGDQMVHDKLGIEVESGHEHHTTFNFQGIMVENHYDFINTKAHKDAKRIEEKLKELVAGEMNNVNEEFDFCLPSADFNVVFLIRHLGQHFAAERVTLRQVIDWGLFLRAEGDNVHWNKVTPFLKEMGIWTFFNQINAICVDYLGIMFPDSVPSIECKEDLEIRILEDILNPEFAEDKPERLMLILWFKTKRWWYNRWKHPLIYDEWLLPMFMTLLWSHLRRVKTIKD